MTDAHAQEAAAVLSALQSGSDGLTSDEAADRLAQEGPNELPKEHEPSVVFAFLKQFHSGLVYLLLVAAGLSWFLGHGFDAYAIIFVVLMNAVIGFVQERRAERALARLREMVVPTASVIRGGNTVRVPVRDLVPGDVVILAQGDRVPADIRIISAKDLEVDESALTGESMASEKHPAPVDAAAGIGDRKSMLHMGTLVTDGQGLGVVVATGGKTAFGAIAASLVSIRRARTPLEKRVDRLGRKLGLMAIGVSVLILLVGLWRGFDLLQMVLIAVAAAVSAIPEGLPAVLAVVLAIGVQRMARRNAVIRHLPAVETLGVVDVICSDKTGTLTENKMTVRRVFTPDHDVRVTGEGWKPEGEFIKGDQRFPLSDHMVMTRLLRAATICNRASLEMRDGRWTAIGEPTEAALVVLGAKAGFDKGDLEREGKTFDEVPFSSERRFRAILHEYVGPSGEPRREIMVVGAFEALAERSSTFLVERSPELMSPERMEQFEKVHADLASEAMRVLAVAVCEVDASVNDLREEDVRGLTLLGLVGMIDPPRKGVTEALERCRTAGIRTIVMTGDHKITAEAVAREIGLLEGDGKGKVFTDQEAMAMDDAKLKTALKEAVIFARVSPETKLRVIKLLQSLGHAVAMTGDGINDAPALKQADVGVAMGITGTDVTKEVADVVLADDNFVSIVNAVEEGRIIFRNVKQSTAYLVTTNAGEVVTMLASLLIGLPLPLLPAQILWLNLVTDGFNTIALAAEGSHGDELSEPPRPSDSKILTKNLMVLSALTAILMSAGTLMLFMWALKDHGLVHARTVAFVALSLFQLWNVFGMRSPSRSILSLGLFSNPWTLAGVGASVFLMIFIMYVPKVAMIFGFEPIGFGEWMLSLAVSSTVVLVVEGWKVLVRKGTVPKSWL